MSYASARMPDGLTPDGSRRPVWSHNEWDRLETVIVGTPDGAHLSAWDAITHAIVDTDHDSFNHQAMPYPADLVERAAGEVNRFVKVLSDFGVEVQRPSRTDAFAAAYSTPFWSWPCGKHAANPRDVLAVFGDLVVEAPTPRRSRHFEVAAYRDLLRQYHRGGARWIAAPPPLLVDDLFVDDFRPTAAPQPIAYPITEAEPVFDAADFLRCGRDIFYQRSFVTNRTGIDWLQRILGLPYEFHEIRSRCRTPLHIDTTLVLLGPGKALYNPEFVDPDDLPECLRSWDCRPAPLPVERGGRRATFQLDSGWLSMNVFSIDPDTVVVDREQIDLIRMLERWNFTVVSLPIQSYYPFGGGFHCCTLDVCRPGSELASYR